MKEKEKELGFTDLPRIYTLSQLKLHTGNLHAKWGQLRQNASVKVGEPAGTLLNFWERVWTDWQGGLTDDELVEKHAPEYLMFEGHRVHTVKRFRDRLSATLPEARKTALQRMKAGPLAYSIYL